MSVAKDSLEQDHLDNLDNCFRVLRDELNNCKDNIKKLIRVPLKQREQVELRSGIIRRLLFTAATNCLVGRNQVEQSFSDTVEGQAITQAVNLLRKGENADQLMEQVINAAERAHPHRVPMMPWRLRKQHIVRWYILQQVTTLVTTDLISLKMPSGWQKKEKNGNGNSNSNRNRRKKNLLLLENNSSQLKTPY